MTYDDGLKSLADVSRGAIRNHVLFTVRAQLRRSNGQYVTSLKAIVKRTTRHFNLRSSGGVVSIVRGALIWHGHPDMTITWFDEKETQLEIKKKK